MYADSNIKVYYNENIDQEQNLYYDGSESENSIKRNKINHERVKTFGCKVNNLIKVETNEMKREKNRSKFISSFKN